MIDLTRMEELAVELQHDEKHEAAEAMRSAVAEINRLRAQLPSAKQLFTEPVLDKKLSLRFQCLTPTAGKNSRIVRAIDTRKGPRAISHFSSNQTDCVGHIQAEAVTALRSAWPEHFDRSMVLISHNDVAAHMVWNVHQDSLDVVIEEREPPPARGITGRKKDLHNLPELVLDAIQGIAYANDNQVSELRLFKNLGRATTAP